jgi:hypothetical protein
MSIESTVSLWHSRRVADGWVPISELGGRRLTRPAMRTPTGDVYTLADYGNGLEEVLVAWTVSES